MDVLRGFSLLGILTMNIVSFALPVAAYINPAIHGGHEGANLASWLVSHVLFDGKMRAIFSLLFGASAWMILSRHGAGYYYRRTIWLIVFGLIHAHLIWYGDILYFYGVVGLLLYPLRNLRARTLIIAACVAMAVNAAMGLAGSHFLGKALRDAEAGDRVAASGGTPTAEQKSAMAERDKLAFTRPKPEEIEKEIAAHRGGWLANFHKRHETATLFETTMFLQLFFLDVLGALMLGMGLAKAGVLDGSLGAGFYRGCIAAGLFIGVPFNYWTGTSWIATGFKFPEWLGYVTATMDICRILVGGAYVGAVVLMCKSGALPRVRSALGAVGRMALTNYLMTSVVMVLIFDGYGLGLFARHERAWLWPFVLGMWAVNVAFSSWWLPRYGQGPAERLWRWLSGTGRAATSSASSLASADSTGTASNP